MPYYGMRRLPPLNSLKAFEACARHLSFTRAGQELRVTQGAISRHVKQLEEYFGLQLFRRNSGDLELTDQGRKLYPVLFDSLDRIADISSRLQQTAPQLNVMLHPSFALRWLYPRLGKFTAQHPAIKVRTTASHMSEDFAEEDFDAAIICGAFIDKNDKHVACELVVPESLTPACSPRLIRESAPLRHPKDLFRLTLLHPTMEEDFWRRWFEAQDILYEPDLSVEPLRFEIMDTAVQAAIQGIGVTLVNPQFVKEEVALGRLVYPFEKIALAISGYYFVCPKAKVDQPEIMAFRNWLHSESGFATSQMDVEG